jgi:SAM-dependent methyltransferase
MDLENNGDYQTAARMALKKKAIPIPDLRGKTVLDVGCDHGFWCWEAAARGAKRVVGIDRNRMIRGSHFNLIGFNSAVAKAKGFNQCEFMKYDIGKQFPDLGKFDVVFCFSMYHHAFANCGDHYPVWHWLRRHCREVLLWENPTGPEDSVVKLSVEQPYNRADILQTAGLFNDIEEIGPAMHVKTRTVWRCFPHNAETTEYNATMLVGSGGANKAFSYADGRRIFEIENILDFRPVPGSLNVKVNRAFDWDGVYYRAQVLDPVSRANLNGEWRPRWARFYPLMANDKKVFAFRFEGENYKTDYVELIADDRLRELLPPAFKLTSTNG